ncbi:MAG: hypothetical protein WKF96_01670 [Solirubrobacteraceae bacterium]
MTSTLPPTGYVPSPLAHAPIKLIIQPHKNAAGAASVELFDECGKRWVCEHHVSNRL